MLNDPAVVKKLQANSLMDGIDEITHAQGRAGSARYTIETYSCAFTVKIRYQAKVLQIDGISDCK